MGQKELDLIINAIAEAKEITRKGHEVKVYISPRNGLRAIIPTLLVDILLKLQDDYKIIAIRAVPHYWLRENQPKPYLDYFAQRFPNLMSEFESALPVMNGAYSNIKDTQDYSSLYFIVDILDGFDKWYADYWGKRNHSSGETLTPIVTQRKPSWAKTNVPWNIKKLIWKSWAEGDTIKTTQNFFELHQGEYEDAPFDKATIRKVRTELCCLPDELEKTLVTELPEVSSLIQQQKADFKITPQ